MYSATTCVPESSAGDSRELIEALEIARALWDKGEKSDAVRWLRRAMEAADDAGDLTRVATLARAAAELSEAPPASRPAPPLPPQSELRVASHVSRPPVRSTPPPLPSVRALKPAPKPTLLPPVSSATMLAAPLAAPPAPRESVQAELRVRVSVQTSVRDPNLLVVRRLADGKTPPPGTREAFLVMTDGGAE
jgi:hypothetical protein